MLVQNEKPDGCAFNIAPSNGSNSPLCSPTHPSLSLVVHLTLDCHSQFLPLKACRDNSSSRCGEDQMTSTEPAVKETKSIGEPRWAGNPGLWDCRVSVECSSSKKTVCIACMSCEKNPQLLLYLFWDCYLITFYKSHTSPVLEFDWPEC